MCSRGRNIDNVRQYILLQASALGMAEKALAGMKIHLSATIFHVKHPNYTINGCRTNGAVKDDDWTNSSHMPRFQAKGCVYCNHGKLHPL